MATKRSAAAKKAARTRARNTAKRRAAGRKAARTRQRTPGKPQRSRGRSTRQSGGSGGGGGFGSSVVGGLGFAVGAGLFALLSFLLFAPIGEEEQESTANTAPALDTSGLSPEDKILLEQTIATWQPTTTSTTGGDNCHCWQC